MATELVETPSATTAMITVIERAALNPEVDVAKMQQLLEMQLTIMDKQAEQAFARDFALMQADIPSVLKRGKSNNNTYATYDDLMDAVRGPAALYGFAISFEPDSSDGVHMKVIAEIRHREGHVKTSTMTLPFETSGSKNQVQAIGSAQKYGMRYALVGMLGLSTHDGDDDDGNGVFERIDDDKASTLAATCSNWDLNQAKIFGYYSKKWNVVITDWRSFPANSFDEVMATLERQGKAKTDADS